MNSSVGVHEAKTRLSDLLRTVEEGGTVTITRRGKPVAELRRITDAGLQESGSLQWDLPDRKALIEVLEPDTETTDSFYSGD